LRFQIAATDARQNAREDHFHDALIDLLKLLLV